jgi:5-amino-6-(5-phospho-D-ribitylamino)uracil phosphatase
MKRNRQAFVTDLDGTLLRSNATISPETVTLLNELINEDCTVSFSTARSILSSMKIVSQVSWKYPIIVYNGALIYDPVLRKVVGGAFLDGQIADEIIQIGRQIGLKPFWFMLDASNQERVLHKKLERFGDLEFYRSRPNDPRFVEVELLKSPSGSKSLIITYIGHRDELDPLMKAVVSKFGANQVYVHYTADPYIHNHYFLEFSHPRANKGDSILEWAKHIGIDQEKVTVFGDNLNDIRLFELAGTRVAVRNAHEQLKKLADEIIGSNDEDSVAKYIRSRYSP